jgi:hypothetical protein
MSDFVEAIVSLLPREIGGREIPVAPREGSYRPFARAGSDVLRIRMIEGPPRLDPGDEARVVLELETSSFDETLFVPGAELDLVEHGGRMVGIVSVLRLWRTAAALCVLPLLVSLLLGCSSSSDAGVMHETIEGGPGQPISVQVSTKPTSAVPFEQFGQPRTTLFTVEVSNNSEADVVVEQIAITQSDSGTEAYQMDPVTRRFKELIGPGKDHSFELQGGGRQVRMLERGEPSRIVVRVAVLLQSGEQYVYDVEVPITMQSR